MPAEHPVIDNTVSQLLFYDNSYSGHDCIHWPDGFCTVQRQHVLVSLSKADVYMKYSV